MDKIYNYFINRFQNALVSQDSGHRRIGAELKFPLVNQNGTAASLDTTRALWDHLVSRNWRPIEDAMAGQIIGATKPGEQNATIAGYETGFCKIEFALAHVANLFGMERLIDELRVELKPFCKENNVLLLCYGIQPVTPPGKKLVMKKNRTSPWIRVFRSNRHISEGDGDDVHLFTINAANHVHISVSLEEAVDAVNVLNGFAGAQIALTAHSNIWQGQMDPQYNCVAEKFWDWWLPDSNRVGVPIKPFRDVKDYVRTIANFKPVYVLRNGKPIILKKYKTFEEYYRLVRAVGLDTEGREISFVPEKADIDLHNSCYWYNARISRHYTVENRVNDQQPPNDLICISALTLGLISALAEAKKHISTHDWQALRTSRNIACRDGLLATNGGIRLSKLALRMLYIARKGLLRRGLGEEKFLEPLETRLCELSCPADKARKLFRDGGINALINTLKF
ncbi:MAG: hypothetical protein PVH77_03680 [Phycisphaerales bacterium]|jgi:gamma-glutamylcysteine synthetase